MAAKTIEKRVSDSEEIIDDIPRLVNLRFSFLRAQIETLDVKVDRLDQRMSTLAAEMRVLPRVFAEMLDERAKRGR